MHLPLERITACQILAQNRDCRLPHLHLMPPLGGFPSEYCHPVWYKKQERRKKIWRYVYSFWQNVRHTPHDDIRRTCIASRGKNQSSVFSQMLKFTQLKIGYQIIVDFWKVNYYKICVHQHQSSQERPPTWSGWWMKSDICLASSRRYESPPPWVSRVTGSSMPRLSRYDRNFCVCWQTQPTHKTSAISRCKQKKLFGSVLMDLGCPLCATHIRCIITLNVSK